MSNDPLEAIFVTGDEAAALKRADTARKLATYLERMPVELRGMFAGEFQRVPRRENMTGALDDIVNLSQGITAEKARAELAKLRAELTAAQARIAQLTTDAGESGLAAINRLLAACESGDGIDQHCAPDLQAARDEIVRQAAQLEQAYTIAAQVAENCSERGSGNDRRYKVAMDIARQLREIAANAQPQERIEKSGAVILNGHIKIEGIKDNGENYLTTNLVVNNAVSDVELAAYRYYLGESSNRLYELFEDMPTDERERYRKANAPQEQSA